MSTPDDRIKEASSVETAALEKFLRDIEGDAASVSETIFANTILPALTSEDPSVQNVAIWREYAGVMTRPINVIGTDGKVLFQCPPPVVPPPTIMGRFSVSANDIVVDAQSMEKRHPSLGHNYLKQELSKFLAEDPTAISRLKNWNSILVRYGMEPMGHPSLVNEGVTVPSSTPASKEVSNDDSLQFGEDETL